MTSRVGESYLLTSAGWLAQSRPIMSPSFLLPMRFCTHAVCQHPCTRHVSTQGLPQGLPRGLPIPQGLPLLVVAGSIPTSFCHPGKANVVRCRTRYETSLALVSLDSYKNDTLGTRLLRLFQGG